MVLQPRRKTLPATQRRSRNVALRNKPVPRRTDTPGLPGWHADCRLWTRTSGPRGHPRRPGFEDPSKRPPGTARRLLATAITALLACACGAVAAASARGTAATATAATPAAAPATAPAVLTDPLDSPRWGDMQKEFFDAQPVVFDARIKVSGPAVAEDPLNVPITVDATALAGVEEMIVFADFNPIVKALRFEPGTARAALGFRIKLQQSSPIRAAVRTADGVWRVGGAWVTTTGGGCTLPSLGSGSPEWQERLNEVNGRLVIRIKPNNSILTGFTVRVSITMPAMQAALLTGSGNFTIRDLTGEKVELTLSGSGNFVVDGKVTELTSELTGSGNIQCEDLDAEVVTAKLSGSGNINLNATRELDARLLGSGNIRYGGSPATVKETDSGSGEIIPLR